MTEWEKLCKDIEKMTIDISQPSAFIPLFLEKWKKVRAEGDKLQRRVMYLEGLTDEDCRLMAGQLREIQRLEKELGVSVYHCP